MGKAFLYNVGDVINHLKITEAIKLKEKSYKYICTIDGYEGIISESSLKRGRSCPVCAHQKIKIGVNDLWSTHPEVASWLYDGNEGYFLTAHTHKKTNWKCNVCGNIVNDKQVSVVTKNNHIFCEHCTNGLSYPEKFFISVLEQLKIIFIKQYSPDWANKYMYDFYFEIKNKKYIVEIDGGWHFIDNNMSGRTKEESQFIDKLKDYLAIKHNIEVIRIDCNYGKSSNKYEYVRNNILNSELSKMFDMSLIDFEQCNKYGNTSTYLMAIQLYNSGMFFDEICTELHIGLTTLKNYLKDGTKANLCKYKYNNRRIPIYCPSTKQAFASSTLLYNNSETLFGKKIKIGFANGKNTRKCQNILFEKITKEQFNKLKQESPELCFGDSFVL